MSLLFNKEINIGCNFFNVVLGINMILIFVSSEMLMIDCIFFSFVFLYELNFVKVRFFIVENIIKFIVNLMGDGRFVNVFIKNGIILIMIIKILLIINGFLEDILVVLIKFVVFEIGIGVMVFVKLFSRWLNEVVKLVCCL